MNNIKNKGDDDSRSTAAKDFKILLALLIVLYFVSFHFDFFDIFFEYSRKYEAYELDEIVSVVVFSSILFAVFAFRRWNELRRQMENREKAEAALRESEYLLSAIFETAKDAMFVKDRSLNYVRANPSAADNMGLKVEDLVGRDDTFVFGPELAAEKTAEDKKVLNGETCSVYSSGQVRGRRFQIHTIKVPLIDHNGEIKGVCGIARDISAIKEAEEALTRALEEKEILLKEIHHRVKNNMQVITSLLNLQTSSLKGSEYKEAVKDSQGRIQALALVHEMLYRAENLSSINLDEYITNLAKALAGATKKIKLDLEVEPLVMGINQASPLGLVINELITNTLKYAFPDDREGHLFIKATSAGGQIELHIADDGVGLPEEFDWRTTNTLGLKLVRMLTEGQLRGTLEVKNHTGVQYTIKIPLDG